MKYNICLCAPDKDIKNGGKEVNVCMCVCVCVCVCVGRWLQFSIRSPGKISLKM